MVLPLNAGPVGCAQAGSDQALHHVPAAEANAISENTETLHLSPAVTTAYVGPSAAQRPGVCERSCEELGSMASELSGLRVVVNQLHDSLQKVVGAGRGPGTAPPAHTAEGQARPDWPGWVVRRGQGNGHSETEDTFWNFPPGGGVGGNTQRQPAVSTCQAK